MSFLDYLAAPPYMQAQTLLYGAPMPMMFGRYGHFNDHGCPDEYEWSDPNEQRLPKHMRKLQRAGIMGPVVPDPFSSTGAYVLPPWYEP